MNIAAIVVTYNDSYKFSEWYKHYIEYKDILYKYIIVDNNSSANYFEQVKNKFSHSATIIRRASNGGATLAYNDGIRLALSDSNVDSIMLIGNDIKISVESIKELVNLLRSDKDLGMVEPVILSKDSNIIEDFGCEISLSLQMIPFGIGIDISNITEEVRYVKSVTGGMNLSTREFYEKIGLQDEKLFMYSDEVDMGLRAMKNGFKMAVTSKAVAWHQHINPPGRKIRPAYTGYLIGRNKVYLGYKHFGFKKAFYIFLLQLYRFSGGLVKALFSKERSKFYFFCLLGTFAGIFRLEKNYSFIINNK